LTFIPESDSNSGMFFSSTSMKGCLVKHQEELLALEALPVEALRLAGVKTKGPVAARGRGGEKGAAGQSASGHRGPPLVR
jgi:hypothetical protein